MRTTQVQTLKENAAVVVPHSSVGNQNENRCVVFLSVLILDYLPNWDV